MKKSSKSVTEFKKLYKSNQVKPKATPVASRRFSDMELKLDRAILKLEAIENKLNDLEGAVDILNSTINSSIVDKVTERMNLDKFKFGLDAKPSVEVSDSAPLSVETVTLGDSASP